jgi:hypothetical protein
MQETASSLEPRDEETTFLRWKETTGVHGQRRLRRRASLPTDSCACSLAGHGTFWPTGNRANARHHGSFPFAFAPAATAMPVRAVALAHFARTLAGAWPRSARRALTACSPVGRRTLTDRALVGGVGPAPRARSPGHGPTPPPRLPGSGCALVGVRPRSSRALAGDVARFSHALARIPLDPHAHRRRAWPRSSHAARPDPAARSSVRGPAPPGCSPAACVLAAVRCHCLREKRENERNKIT